MRAKLRIPFETPTGSRTSHCSGHAKNVDRRGKLGSVKIVGLFKPAIVCRQYRSADSMGRPCSQAIKSRYRGVGLLSRSGPVSSPLKYVKSSERSNWADQPSRMIWWYVHTKRYSSGFTLHKATRNSGAIFKSKPCERSFESLWRSRLCKASPAEEDQSSSTRSTNTVRRTTCRGSGKPSQ